MNTGKSGNVRVNPHVSLVKDKMKSFNCDVTLLSMVAVDGLGLSNLLELGIAVENVEQNNEGIPSLVLPCNNKYCGVFFRLYININSIIAAFKKTRIIFLPSRIHITHSQMEKKNNYETNQ